MQFYLGRYLVMAAVSANMRKVSGTLQEGAVKELLGDQKATAFGNQLEAQANSLPQEDREKIRGNGRGNIEKGNEDRKVTVESPEKVSVDVDKEKNIDRLQNEVDTLMRNIVNEAKQQVLIKPKEKPSFEKVLNNIFDGFDDLNAQYDKVEEFIKKVHDCYPGVIEAYSSDICFFSPQSISMDVPGTQPNQGEPFPSNYAVGWEGVLSLISSMRVTDAESNRPAVLEADFNKMAGYPKKPEHIFYFDGLVFSTDPNLETCFSGGYIHIPETFVENMLLWKDFIINNTMKCASNNEYDESVNHAIPVRGEEAPMEGHHTSSSISSWPGSEPEGVAQAGITQSKTVGLSADDDPGDSDRESEKLTTIVSEVQIFESERSDEDDQELLRNFCLAMVTVFSELVESCPDWFSINHSFENDFKRQCLETFYKDLPAGTSNDERLELLKKKELMLGKVFSGLEGLPHGNNWINIIKPFLDQKDEFDVVLQYLASALALAPAPAPAPAPDPDPGSDPGSDPGFVSGSASDED